MVKKSTVMAGAGAVAAAAAYVAGRMGQSAALEEVARFDH